MREVVMQDGSVIVAEIVSFQNGIYTLRSESMGELHLPDSAIQSIRGSESTDKKDVGSIAANPPLSASKEDIKDMQNSVLTDPGLIGMVLALQNDPEIREILQDQEVMGLISAGDVKKLEASPKFIKLMDNPKIRAIIGQMTP